MLVSIRFLAILILLGVGQVTQAAGAGGTSRNSGFNAYIAAGPNFIFPYSIRAGWNDWELGLLGRDFLGVNRVFFINSGVYAGLAMGVNNDAYPTNVGFQGSFGFRWNFLWKFGLRGEMLANTNLNGNATVHGLLGVSYGW